MPRMSYKVRKMFQEGDDIRDAGAEEPEGVRKYRDISYGPNEKWQVLDVYRLCSRQNELLLGNCIKLRDI